MARVVLDTNIVSLILRRQPQTLMHLREAATRNDEIYLCPIVYYEIARGLKLRDARRQMAEFVALIDAVTWSDFERPMWDDAADIWAASMAVGRAVDEPDLLIAVFARALGAEVATNNVRDFANFRVSTTDWAV